MRHVFALQSKLTDPTMPGGMSRFRFVCFVLLLAGAAFYILVARPAPFAFANVASRPPDNHIVVIPRSFRGQVLPSKNFTFHKVPPLELYVFSAYRDPRLDNTIRLVGMAIHQNHTNLRCLIFSDSELETAPAEVQFLPEGHNLKFDAVYVLCRSRRKLGSGLAVELRCEGSSSPRFLLPVQVIPSLPLSSGPGMAVCYPPLHSGFDDVELFVENIEMNRILGFRQFFVYVYKVGPRVRRAVASYAKEGIVHVVSWEAFPLVSGSMYPVPKDYTIHYLGQMVAINDCLYRAMNNPFRVVAFHDFDELIIPHQSQSLSDVVAKEIGPSVSGLSVRCAMFNTMFKDDQDMAAKWSTQMPRLRTQLKTGRMQRILPHRERSKMLVVADRVVTMGIHFVWRYHQHREKQLSPDVALLHHYRAWGRGERVVDRTAWKFRAQLVEAVKRRMQQLA